MIAVANAGVAPYFARMLYLSLRLVHFISMGVWFGSNLLALRDIRTSLAAGPSNIGPLKARMQSGGMLATISGVITLLTGLALIFVLGGFKSVPRAIHIGLLTGIICAVVGGAGVGRTWFMIEKKLDAGADAASLAPLMKRIGMLSGIFQLLWLVTLILMVFRGAVG